MVTVASYAACVAAVCDRAAIIPADHAADKCVTDMPDDTNIGLSNSKIGNYRTLTNMAK